MASEYRLRTRSIHAGEEPHVATRAATPPLVMSNTFIADADQPFSAEDLAEEAPFIYTRWANPTVRRLERKVASLENAEAAVAFSSGMAAVTGLMLHLLHRGDHLVASNVAYAGVIEFVNEMLPGLGVSVTRVDTSDADQVAAAMRPETRLVFVETPCNPILRLADIRAIADLVRETDAALAVDSTFATPLATRPLDMGADYVIHSLTKYMGGHGDALGGIVAGREAGVEALRRRVGIHAGAVLSPFNAWLLLRGMATLALRMQAHSAGAQQVARFLEEHPRVRRVIYPGLRSHRQHDLARRQMELFSGMLAFQVDNGPEVARQLADRLRVVHYAVSLGHHKSLIYYMHTDALQASTFRLDPQALAGYRDFAGDGIFRLSVGLEDPDDLCEDLDQALAS